METSNKILISYFIDKYIYIIIIYFCNDQSPKKLDYTIIYTVHIW